MNDKKEYIKNFIIRSIKGKVDQTEYQQVEANLMNYSREDWRDLKIMVKELAKEAVDEQLDKEFNLPSDWKALMRDAQHSAVNFCFALLDEEVIYQVVLLQKQGELDRETKIIKILPAISQSIDRVVARAPSRSVSGNWKADKSLTNKINKVFREVRGFAIGAFLRGGELEGNWKQKLNKLVGIFESLTPEEIAILKGKLKILVNNCFNKYAPPQVKNSPEIRQLINSTMNLIDVINDEKLVKDFISIVAKMVKLGIQNEQIWKEENLLTVLRQTGTETEAKNLVRNCTQHFNKLAGEGEENHLSTEKEASIIKRLTENNSNPQPNQEDANLKDIGKDNLLIKGLEGSFNNLEDLTAEGFQKEFENVFLNTQIKPKWYQNPWIIWPLVGVGFVIGGLIVWWLTGQKKEKKIDSRSSSWN